MVKNHTEENNLKDKGVYLITHKDTDIKYVGSTTTFFQERWRSHLNGLKRGVGNKVLLNICNKYGIEGFKFSILESMNNSTNEEIRIRERFWIEKYDTYKNGANCTLETECAFKQSFNKPYTEEDKYKLMMSSPTKKKVYLYDKKGTLLYIFPSSGVLTISLIIFAVFSIISLSV
jgi:group I intron endonuclease